jgi:class 3 adenylate cyclase/pimeloyl-ACP methyl ester carboxylesterase
VDLVMATGRLPPETQYTETADGTYIAYQVVGDGPGDVVLLDGWVTPLEARWEHPIVAAPLWRLASFCRLISFDKRGIGLSDKVTLNIVSTLEEWVDDVVSVIDTVGSNEVALVGHHDGAMAAMLFAATHPGRTSALVLVNASARVSRDRDAPWGRPTDLIARRVAGGMSNYGAGPSDPSSATGTNDQSLIRWWARGRRHQASPGTFRAMMRLQLAADLRPALSAVHAPTLVVHRHDDPLWPPEHGRDIAMRIQGARYVELPGSEHHWQFGDADAIVDEIQEFLTGSRPALRSDRVLATLLFIDIVDSTGVARRLGDHAWRDVLDRHESAVRKQITRYRGREVFTKGDEFLIVFDGPARAVRCAAAISDVAGQLELELRAGVHTGEVERRGGDVAGIAVHIAARIMAAAEPGQILVSRTVTDLVAGSGLTFDDAGQYALRGVEGRRQLFAVAGEPAGS